MMFRLQTKRAALATLAAAAAAATTRAQETDNFNYTPEQCNSWVNAAIASDSGTGGLTRTEFTNFLSSIPEIQQQLGSSPTFEELPFKVQLAYPTLLCWCDQLGFDEGCCEEANNPTIIVSALENPQSEEAFAYRVDFCSYISLVIGELNPDGITTTTTTTTTEATEATTTATDTSGTSSTEVPSSTTVAPPTNITFNITGSVETDDSIITFNITGSVIDYSTFPYSQIISSESESTSTANEDKLPSYSTADDIQSNADSRVGAIGNLIQGFTVLSLDALGECPAATTTTDTTTKKLEPSLLGSLGETMVYDVKCPANLTYAPEGGYCVEFIVTMKPSEELATYEGVQECLVTNINKAIEDGDLYKTINDISGQKTVLTGLGTPGAGVDYREKDKEQVVTNEDDGSSGGLNGGFIFLIILALFALPLIMVIVFKLRDQKEAELAQVREFAGEPAKDTDLESPPTPPPADISVSVAEEEGKRGDDESDAGSQSDFASNEDPASPERMSKAMKGSSLAAMGVASAMATNLYEKKSKSEDEQEVKELEDIKAEVRRLVEKTAPGKTAEELLSAYESKEEELVSHLRRLDRETS